ncbi:uncharacterized protein LOC110377374 [Helicoverpa armigera]|uniref:uncharacterized protein LOC110377374 n=1 Tax=Helicoverpa armigera TaxID=29058 RepID=UPI000B3A0F94|nr:uncharacterized protein LOC110377374 [Helicoverpa armigera]XP_021191930.1 uncharacterized protein LOC110377374 [Helicoverpa armigera]XP_047024164.1 uncharacterized protein LOC124633111 [Helicoverpa zea]PZC86503.1 hypothetical protein B5X24_HaOG209222 [Helicoverpa armigera]
MFKQQISPRTVHPYQTTVVPRSEQQFASAAQQRAKYPWAEDINTPVYQVPGTDSSTSDNAYQMPHYYNGTVREYGPPSPVYQSPYGGGTWRNYKNVEKVPTHRLPAEAYSFPQCASAFSLPLCDVEPHSQTANRSPVPPVPSISPEVPIIGACGGHCPGFEYVCYYILQVIFVVGILTGISLCIAGIVLRRTNRNGDLGVLVYIGCLSSCVCGVLLGVQCCVRREIRQRKLRANMHIPMQSIQEPPAQACPLLTSTLPHSQVYRPTVNICSEEDVTGVPWWRRNNRD